MFLLAVAMYFLLACLLSWLVLFPAGRDVLLATLERAGLRWRRRVAAMAERREHGARALRRGTGMRLAGAAAFLRRHWLLCCAGLALVCVPPLVALLAGGRPVMGGFESSTREINPQVAGLLEGE